MLTSHPRSAAQDVAQKDRTAAYRCGRTHGLPCAMFGRLMPCSPGSRIPSGLPRLTKFTGTAPVGADAASARLGRSDDGRDHTVLPYASTPCFAKRLRRASAPFVQRGLRDAHGVRLNPSPGPALTSATTLPTSTATRSAARDDVRPPLFAGSGWAIHTTNPNFGKVEYFGSWGLTEALLFCRTSAPRPCGFAPAGRGSCAGSASVISGPGSRAPSARVLPE